MKNLLIKIASETIFFLVILGLAFVFYPAMPYSHLIIFALILYTFGAAFSFLIDKLYSYLLKMWQTSKEKKDE